MRPEAVAYSMHRSSSYASHAQPAYAHASTSRSNEAHKKVTYSGTTINVLVLYLIFVASVCKGMQRTQGTLACMAIAVGAQAHAYCAAAAQIAQIIALRALRSSRALAGHAGVVSSLLAVCGHIQRQLTAHDRSLVKPSF